MPHVAQCKVGVDQMGIVKQRSVPNGCEVLLDLVLTGNNATRTLRRPRRLQLCALESFSLSHTQAGAAVTCFSVIWLRQPKTAAENCTHPLMWSKRSKPWSKKQWIDTQVLRSTGPVRGYILYVSQRLHIAYSRPVLRAPTVKESLFLFLCARMGTVCRCLRMLGGLTSTAMQFDTHVNAGSAGRNGSHPAPGKCRSRWHPQVLMWYDAEA